MGEKAPPRLMLVEDDPDAALLICETLRDHFGHDCVQHCSTVAQTLAIDLFGIDLILSDMNLPDGNGLDLLIMIQERRPDLPVVMVTGEGILDNAISAIRQGAYDYVVKAGDYLFAIPIVVEKNLELWRMKQENRCLATELNYTLEQVRIKNEQLEQAVRRLETMAATDPLTGLANRRSFAQAMDRSFAEAVRHGQDIACIMIDLDGFKQLNDTLGHQKGDQVLQRAARVLEANCRRSDMAGRFGGDEFIVLFPQTDQHTAAHVAKRISGEFSHAAGADLAIAGVNQCISMSMGLATFCLSRATSPDQLIAHADHALYCAKQAGKTRLIIYNPTDPASDGEHETRTRSIPTGI